MNRRRHIAQFENRMSEACRGQESGWRDRERRKARRALESPPAPF
jgi:hypothetical protein